MTEVDMNETAAETGGSPKTVRKVFGRVVGNGARQDRVGVDRTRRQAPGIRQVHPPDHEGDGAR